MSELFGAVLEMSLWASVAAVIIIIARLCLRKAPKIFSYILWSVVFFRLLCPLGISIPINIQVTESRVIEDSENEMIQTFTEQGIEYEPTSDNQSTEPYPYTPLDTPVEKLGKSGTIHFLWVNWLIGIICMAFCGVHSYLKLRKKLKTAFRLDGITYQCENIKTAFVLGVFRPKIYIPDGLTKAQKNMVIAHEQAHIRRCDHIAKLIAYCALAVHWFNPLVWLCFNLMCEDMEKSCDEVVIRNLKKSKIAAYCETLLETSERGSPYVLAFSENSTKKRVLNIVNFKRCTKYAAALISVVCVMLIAVCTITPKVNAYLGEYDSRHESEWTEYGANYVDIYDCIDSSLILNGREYPSDPDSLTELYIPEGYLAVAEFHDLPNLRMVALPDSVTALGIGALSNNPKLESVYLGGGLTRICGEAFWNDTALKEIILPDSVEKIEHYAFSCCSSLEYIVIPPKVENIVSGTFEGCDRLVDVFIGESVTYISDEAFTSYLVGKQPLVFHIKDNPYAEKYAKKHGYIVEEWDGETITLTEFQGIPEQPVIEESYVDPVEADRFVGEWFFRLTNEGYMINGYNGEVPAEIVVPNNIDGYSIIGLDASCFRCPPDSEVSALEKVVISEGIKILRCAAFDNCRNLTDVTLPETLEYIDGSVFQGCTSLKELYIPESVTYIDELAFVGCSAELTLLGNEGSYVQEYAERMGMRFKAV